MINHLPLSKFVLTLPKGQYKLTNFDKEYKTKEDFFL